MAPSLIVMMEKQWLSVLMDAYTCLYIAQWAHRGQVLSILAQSVGPMHPLDE